MPTTAEQASRNAHGVSSYPKGYCLRFVRERWEVGPLAVSAEEAWNIARFKHPGDRRPPLSAPCYYAGGTWGHIVLACPVTHLGMRSTDCFTTGRVSDTDLDWPSRSWGAAYRYLGWSEDLNGIRVIEEDDMPSYSEWTDADKRALANDVTDAVWDRIMSVTKPDGTKADKSAGRIIRETWSKLANHMDKGGGGS